MTPSTGSVAVALAWTSFGFHLGIAYQLPGSASHELLHLKFHRKLRREPLPSNSFHLEPVNVGLRNTALAQYCSYVAQKNPPASLNYGFSYSRPTFDESGDFVSRPGFEGLTCATFVLSVLESFGIPVVDHDNWPTLPADEAWQNQMMCYLASEAADSLELCQWLVQLGSPRFTPAEVTCAAATNPARRPAPRRLVVVPALCLERSISARLTKYAP